VRNTIVGSTLAHGGLVALLFIVRPSQTVVIPGPDVVQVSLIGEPMPPPAPEPVVKANDAVTPDEEQGVQIEKPRPKPKPEVKQQPKPVEPTPPRPRREETPPPTTSSKRIVLPYAPVAGGLSGSVAVDDANFEFAYYLQMVRAQIGRNWSPPQGAATGARVEVYFRVSRSGGISGLRIETASGNETFDQSATRAVIITEQLPPLPLGYSGSDLGIHFGFEYTGP
jgi:periplasmic protein TonB